MDTIRLRTGTEVIVRPIEHDDGPRLSAAFGRLSPQARYQRFLAAKPFLTPSEVKFLVDIDHLNHVALVATLRDEPERIIAVARFVRLPADPRAAEFAVVVGDAWQRGGLASALLRRLVEEAPAHKIERVYATMLAENEGAHHLMRTLGRPTVVRRRGPVHDFEIDLTR